MTKQQVDEFSLYIPQKYWSKISNSSTSPNTNIVFSTGKQPDSTLTTIIKSTVEQEKDISANWVEGDGGGLPATTDALGGTMTSVGTAVTGSGTSFTTEFESGDILWSTAKNEGRQIKSVDSDTAITLFEAYTTDISSADVVKRNGLAPNASYHCFELAKLDGSAEQGFDANASGSNLLIDAVGYVKYRRVGSIVTDSSSNIIQFRQDGNTITYLLPPVNKSGVVPIADTVLTFDHLPSGILIKAQVSYVITEGDQGTVYGWIYSPLQDTLTPTSAFYNAIQISGTSHLDTNNFNGDILTNDGTIKHYFNSNAGGVTYSTNCVSYIDLFED